MSGAAKDIGIDGRKVWVVGTNKEGGGYGIYKYNGNNRWIKYLVVLLKLR